MTTVLQIFDQKITAEDVFPLLERYQLLPHLFRQLIIDRAITEIECTEAELTEFHQQLNPKKDNVGEQSQNLQQPEENLVRSIKIQKFKQLQWQHKLESYFLQRKNQLDQVIYSLIRIQDVGMADELYFRLQEGEQTFAELAAIYSQGSEAQTGGVVGPVEIGCYHPSFAHILSSNPPGQLMPPIQLEEWVAILRIEQYIPAQLDEAMRQRLLDELFENWLQTQLEQILSWNTGQAVPMNPFTTHQETLLTSTLKNKEIAQRFFEETWIKGNLEIVDEFTSPDFKAYYPIFPEPLDCEGLKAFLVDVHAGFPDLQLTITDTIAEVDKVVICWIAKGTHKGHINLLNLPPTGRAVSYTGVEIYRLSEGKIVEGHAEEDTLGLLQQLGVLPTL